MLQWIGWLLGYVTVSVTGGSPERFMNLCAFKRKDVWNFARVENGLLVNVRVSEYKNLRSAARTAGCRMHIVRRHGLPFAVRRYRRRFGLLLGLILFAFLLNFLCARVWQIDVKGNESLTEREVLQILAEFDIKEGVAANGRDWATVRQSILSAHPEIAWMSLNPEGTVLHVNVSETVEKPLSDDRLEPCNLKASVDGRIVEMQVYRGTAAVREGDAVVKGDLLVSGVVEYADGCTVFQHASAHIVAETVHTASFPVKLKQTAIRRTGRVIQRRVLTFFGLSIPLYIGSVDGRYEKETQESPLVVGGVKLPFSIQTASFYPVEEIPVTLTESEAVAEGAELTDAYIAENLPDAEITEVKYDHAVKNGVLTVTAQIFCRESISFEEKLLIF